MTQKYDAFVAALRALCEEHEVDLCTEGYEKLVVWDLDPGQQLFCCDYIEDQTGQTPVAWEPLRDRVFKAVDVSSATHPGEAIVPWKL